MSALLHLSGLIPYLDPNPAPPPGAPSQTFVSSTKTVIIAVPTTTITITVGAATITLQSGGTPIGGPVPTGVSQPGAVTPTWGELFVSGLHSLLLIYPALRQQPDSTIWRKNCDIHGAFLDKRGTSSNFLQLPSKECYRASWRQKQRWE
jgi:hypothetical protein